MTQEQGNGGISAIGVALLAVAAMALGAAINVREGMYAPSALLWLNVAVLSVLGVLFLPRGRLSPALGWLPYLVLGCSVAFQFAQLYRAYPGTLWNNAPTAADVKYELATLKDQERFIKDPQEHAAAVKRMDEIQQQITDPKFRLAILLAAALAALSLLPTPAARWTFFSLALVLHFAIGAWLIQKSPDPHIDVYLFQQNGSAELMAGNNPYKMGLPDIYGAGSQVYAKDLAKDGRLLFSYPYMPTTLFMALPGYIAGQDVRYADLAAITLAGLLIVLARPGVLSILAAFLLLFTPRSFMIAQLAWTEPFLVLLLAATVFCALRYPRVMPFVLGIFLVSKQYMLFAVPAAFLLLGGQMRLREGIIMLVKAAIAAAVISLPLILWDYAAFKHSAITLQFHQPFRSDALSYLAYFWWNGHSAGAEKVTWLAFVAAALMAAVALWRLPRTPAGFAAAVGVTYLAFFALNKQAFCNYYFFVIGAMCCAVAVAAESRKTAATEPIDARAAQQVA